MPISIQSLSSLKRTVIVPVEDEETHTVSEIHITYKLSAMNLDLTDWLAEHTDDRGSIMGWLERLIVKWDVNDEAGQPLPATTEVMERYKFPTPILRLILDACYFDGSAGNLKEKWSAGSSASGTSRQNGSR